MLPVSLTLASYVIPGSTFSGIISYHGYRRFKSWTSTSPRVPYFRWSNNNCQDTSMDSARRLSSGETCGDNTKHIDKEYPRIMKQLLQVEAQNLTEAERAIHDRHSIAMQRKEDFYVDPATTFQVMTSLAHLKRGDCCGNECRHCPYGHANVPDSKKTKTFNSSFYV